ncbi:threonine synthase-like 2 isoform X2 [Symsagittifera roscoffensis]
MTTCPDDNVHCFQVQGSCDDLDLVYLDLFADKTLTDEFNLTSANSTNWVRIMGQVAIFTHIYLRVIHQCQPQKNVGDRVKIVIPSGACGNVCSALFAVRMGLPLDIVVANNSNAFFRTIYHTGVIVVESGNQRQTVSNAMDSQWSPALTRILFLLSPRDNTGLYDQHALQKLKRAEPINVPCKALASLREQVCGCEVASDEETIAMMKHLNQNQYASKHQNTRSNSSDRNHDSSINNKGLVVCPHTAVGFVALKKHLQGPAETGADKKNTLDFNLVQNTECANMLEDIDPVVVLATAHPDKFSHVIKDRAGLEYNVTHSFPSAEERFVKLDKDEDWRKRIVEMIKSAN